MTSGIGSELRHTLRGRRRSPGFTVAAVLSLALGIGAHMAMFGVVKSLLLTPLPVDAPDELSLVTWRREGEYRVSQYGSSGYTDLETGLDYNSNLSYPIYRAMREVEMPPVGGRVGACVSSGRSMVLLVVC